MLTREAFNALLKTLEEPPQHVIFILATTEAHKVPETIVSRTQRYSFKPIVEVDALEHLRKISDKESIKITDEALKLIANHGQGSFRDSISMLDQLAGISSSEIGASEVSLLLGVPDNQLLDDLISSVASNDPNSLFETLQNLREQGASPGNIAKEIISRLRKSLYNNDNQITATKAVSIMKALLNATGSNASYEQIEICLLESINFDENIKPGDKTLDPNENDNFIENNIAEDLNQKNASEDISIEVQDKSEKIIEQATDNSWDKILQLMKSQHNTLYGVLRMADATIADGKIILTFSFEFHKKQLEQNRNIEVLKKVINDSLGEKHEVQLLLKKPTIEPKKTDNSDKNKALSSVSNIFGDAELLE
jgi:DNA polymerase-3 subunit gamma/tau